MSQDPNSREDSLREVRLGKLQRLRELGLDPYLVERFPSTDSATNLVGDGFEEQKTVTFAGRVVSYRLMGKAGFAHLSDGDGRIQAYFRRDDLSPEHWEAYGLLDIGDHVGVEGYLFVTKTGERSIHVSSLTPLSKALHALPIGKEKDGETFSGLSDPELRFRHRHLDLVANKDAREMLLNRARIVSAVRRYFDSLGYLEVETPMLQIEAGGAAARPFKTHYIAYDLEVKLRISLELYLKRLICGDIPKVYEVGRVFRNEGVSNRHSPEFTMLEFYEAYVDLETMMERVEGCFRSIQAEVFGTSEEFLLYQLRKSTGIEAITFDAFAADIGHSSVIRIAESAIERSQDSRSVAPGEQIPFGPPTIVRGAYDSLLVDGEVAIKGHPLYEQRLFVGAQGADILVKPTFVSYPTTPPATTINIPGGEYVVRRDGFKMPKKSDFPDFAKSWRRVDLLSEIERLANVPTQALMSLQSAKAHLGANPVTNPLNGKKIDPEEENTLGGLIEKLLEVFVEPTLREPTFVVGYPIETSPLAKKDPNRPGFTRRFEGYVLGREVCNAFSEINDPIDQRERFEQQLGERAKGDDEAHPMDEEFLFALESGMPPTGGCGIGLDRMAMLLTGANSIREVLMFPTMKPSVAHTAEDADEMDEG